MAKQSGRYVTGHRKVVKVSDSSGAANPPRRFGKLQAVQTFLCLVTKNFKNPTKMATVQQKFLKFPKLFPV
jgi:hypothetical protein